MGEEEVKNLYEFSKGHFLKFVMVYYYNLVIISVSCHVSGESYQSCIVDRETQRQQPNFYERAATLYEELDADSEHWPFLIIKLSEKKEWDSLPRR